MKELDTYLSISQYTTPENNKYHAAMCYAGWIPFIGTVGIMEWKNSSGQLSLTYESAQDFYNEHGCAPVPF
jgi:hypothetical protein